VLEWKGRRRSAGRHAGLHGGDAGLKQRRGCGRRKKGGDGWGRCVSEGKKKRRWGRGPLREGKDGPWAGWAKMKVRSFSFFFFFFFSNSFKIEPFQHKFNQNFSNFFIKFYKPFKPHTNNQKHA
jgi:hypothetical protein